MKKMYLFTITLVVFSFISIAQTEIEPNDNFGEANVSTTCGPFIGTADIDWQGDLWRLDLSPGTYTLDWVGDTCTRVRVIEFQSSWDPAVETPNSTPGASSDCSFTSLSYGCRLVDNLDDGFEAIISESFTVVAGRHYYFFKNPHNCLGSSYNTGGSLPVELVDFGVTVEEDHIRLDWSTLLEIDNALFEIELSPDMKVFSKIGSVVGYGNSSTEIAYHYNYHHISSETMYIRLKQIDYDGNYEYSNIITVEGKKRNGLLDCSVYYTKEENQLFVKFHEAIQSDSQFELFDCHGNLHIRDKILAGENSKIISPPFGLLKGTYIVNIYNKKDIKRTKIIIY